MTTAETNAMRVAAVLIVLGVASAFYQGFYG